MQQLSLLCTTIIFLFISCNESTDDSNIIGEPEIPQYEIPYEVNVTTDIVYAKGLSHESINSELTSLVDLKLDVYAPENEITNRPALLFLHGGGFIGGAKQDQNIEVLANYLAQRGWVVFSADYRLMNDYGTVPDAWENAAELVEESKDQFLAMYPAQRDAKAALRWINKYAEDYNIDTENISVGGSSAGAITAISLGISEPEDFTNELTESEDSTLITTHIEQTYTVRSIIDFWGSTIAIDSLSSVYDLSRFDSDMPPILIVHGTEDETVLFAEAEDLRDIYDAYDTHYEFYALEGKGHGPWSATVDGLNLADISYNFLENHLKQ